MTYLLAAECAKARLRALNILFANKRDALETYAEGDALAGNYICELYSTGQ